MRYNKQIVKSRTQVFSKSNIFYYSIYALKNRLSYFIDLSSGWYIFPCLSKELGAYKNEVLYTLFGSRFYFKWLQMRIFNMFVPLHFFLKCTTNIYNKYS